MKYRTNSGIIKRSWPKCVPPLTDWRQTQVPDEHTDAASHILVYTYTQSTGLQAITTSNYLPGRPQKPTQQERRRHHPRIKTRSQPREEQNNTQMFLIFWKEVLVVFEVCGTSWIAKLVFHPFSQTHNRFCECCCMFFYAFVTFSCLCLNPFLAHASRKYDSKPSRTAHAVIPPWPLLWPLRCSYITCAGWQVKVEVEVLTKCIRRRIKFQCSC